MNNNPITIRTWGDFACFIRPDLHREHVSYPIMTPAAARSVLEAIFWTPEIYYLITTLHIVQRGNWLSLPHPETLQTISLDSPNPTANTPAQNQPRSLLALQNVEYLITADMQLTEIGKKKGHPLNTYLLETQRRAKMGKCHHRPYLGIRQFAADFAWEAHPQTALMRRADELGKNWRHIWPQENLGLLLYDVYAPQARAHGFRWLAEGDHLADPHAHPKHHQKHRHTLSPPYTHSLYVQPEPLYFTANVRAATLDCHPARVRFAPAQTYPRPPTITADHKPSQIAPTPAAPTQPPQTAITNPLKHRHDILILFEITNSTPNGLPRLDPNTHCGLVTDEYLKHQVRNFVQTLTPVRPQGTASNGNNNLMTPAEWLTIEQHPDQNQQAEVTLHKLCRENFAIRAFGSVLCTDDSVMKGHAYGQINGPVQLTYAQSLHPITRPYALYVAQGYVSPAYAERTGFSQNDLALLFQALLTPCPPDHPTGHGEIVVRGLYDFEHIGTQHPNNAEQNQREARLGCASAHKLFDGIKISLTTAATSKGYPEAYNDYQINCIWTEQNLPPGVRLHQRHIT